MPEKKFESLETHPLNDSWGIILVLQGLKRLNLQIQIYRNNYCLCQVMIEFVSSPLSAGGVGVCSIVTMKYKKIEKKSSTNAFQALWVEYLLEKKSNIIYGIIYRQHNSPESFQACFDEALERFSQPDKTICIMGDFNINPSQCRNMQLH